MSTTEQDAPRTGGGDVDRHVRCAVCDHAIADHDPVSLRYCHATQAQALSRGCICPE
ncbi:MAG TPA: RGCVC family protein [Jatrophihabitans sp.]|jgi:hypothetical protein